MAITTFFRASDGDSVIPTANGDHTISGLNADMPRAELYLAFYNDANGTTPVTPTAGTVTVYGEYFDNIFLDGQNNVVQASEVSAPNATFAVPTLDGLLIGAKITVAGITGATHMRAAIFKHND